MALDGLEQHLRDIFPHDYAHQQALINLVRYADDFVRHEAQIEHGAQAPAAGRRAVSLSS
jgi:hypothetical protein